MAFGAAAEFCRLDLLSNSCNMMASSTSGVNASAIAATTPSGPPTTVGGDPALFCAGVPSSLGGIRAGVQVLTMWMESRRRPGNLLPLDVSEEWSSHRSTAAGARLQGTARGERAWRCGTVARLAGLAFVSRGNTGSRLAR